MSTMRFHSRVLIAVAGLAFASTVVHVQMPAPLTDARIDHISVAVRDMDRTLRLFADVLGIDPVMARLITVQTPEGSKVDMKLIDLNVSNFFIEVDSPNGTLGPTQEFLDKHGQGIQHLGHAIPK